MKFILWLLLNHFGLGYLTTSKAIRLQTRDHPRVRNSINDCSRWAKYITKRKEPIRSRLSTIKEGEFRLKTTTRRVKTTRIGVEDELSESNWGIEEGKTRSNKINDSIEEWISG